LFLIFTLLSKGLFVTPKVIDLLSTSASELGIIALGVAMLMISGEFDLSVGSITALGALVVAALYRLGVNPFLALVAAVGVGAIAGMINGLITVKFGIPSFITTLGAMMLYRGVIYIATGGLPIDFFVSKTHPSFSNFLEASLGIISAPLVWFVAIGIFFALLLGSHRFGNRVYATGGGKEAARAMGISTDRVKVICFMMAEALAALSGVMQLTRTRAFHATQGSDVELMAIAAIVVGGVSIFGGEGTIAGAIIGVLIMTFLEFGLIFAGVSGFWYKVVLGALIIIVVTTNEILERRNWQS
jgi:simple sugar transport system permease protein